MNDRQTIIRTWMREELARMGHGSKGRLAAHLGVGRDVVTRMMNSAPGRESRDIRAHELFAMEDFFGSSAPIAGSGIEVPLISWVAAGQLAQSPAVLSDDDFEKILVSDLDPKGDWIALTVQGSSMNRISPPESTIIVNRKDRKLVANACYVVSDGEGGATYKRFRPNPMRFEPVSTDPEHEPIFPDNEPKIVGRVRMSILKM